MRPSKFLLLATLAVAGCGQSTQNQANQTPSVAVSVSKALRGSIPATITAYGTAGPSSGGAQTISTTQPGQVVSFMVMPGESVRAGQTLATFAVTPTARSTYLQARTALLVAQKQRASTAELLSQHLATADQLAQADKAVSDALAAVSALQAEGAGQPLRTITSPFNGVVTAIPVAQGDHLQPGASIITLARMKDIVVTVGVDPEKRQGIAPGQTAVLHRLSDGAAVNGRVVRGGAALNPRTRFIDVELAISPDFTLPGEAFQASINTKNVTGWIVPHSAMITANGPVHLFQIINNKAKSVPVRILLSTEKNDVVDGPLNPSKPVIVDGAYQVNDGDLVRVNG